MHSFTCLDDIPVDGDILTHYQHSSGLQHYQLTTTGSQRFHGVFIVKTPSTDDSGLAHAVEHLVFRRSTIYPNPQTLFQITALSDIKINASTLNNFTYFHFSSTSTAGFKLAIRYLLSGMLKPYITRLDIEQEVFNPQSGGVIFHELCGYQLMTDPLVPAMRGDHSSQRINCHGGMTDTLSSITLEAAIHYHAKHYQPTNIVLLTDSESPEPWHIEMHDLLDTLNTPPPSTIVQYPRITCHPEQQYLDMAQVYTWWLPSSFYESIQKKTTWLQNKVRQLGGRLLPIENDVNHLGELALRVVSEQQHINRIQQVLVAALGALSPTPLSDWLPDNKFSSETNRMITLFHRYCQPKVESSSNDIIIAIRQKPNRSRLSVINIPALAPLFDTPEKSIQPTPTGLIKGLKLVATEQKTGRSFSAKDWQQVALHAFDENINTDALRDIVTKKFGIAATSIDRYLIINQHRFKFAFELAQVIDTSPQCRYPTIPSCLSTLYAQLNENRSEKKPNSRCFGEIKQLLGKKNRRNYKFNVMLTSVYMVSNKQHCLCQMQISNEFNILAHLAQYVIAASAPFLAARISGECYSIGIRYMPAARKLYIFSVFDRRPQQRLEQTCKKLAGLTRDRQYLKPALELAKQLLINEQSQRLQHLSSSQRRALGKMAQQAYDEDTLHQELNRISLNTLIEFIGQLSNTINLVE
ncbi:hypothetical protein BIY22_11785 [Vibrio panuliri]|uniref:Peptidase M16 N-terminal domain-containing protein n=2 Tax=Vibrio panuliri TaxID=1381081 RepID=A0A1Q9HAX7_9VIBR|nr:hypothetical protein BIY22_11785 [Vibrio panuliri]